jgi:hypothetical protein
MCVLTACVQHNGFFWDNVWLVSTPAHWYYDNGFTLLTLPEAIDFGHPPLLGFYIAGVWRLVGKSVEVSHWAMLPVLLGIVWEAHRFVEAIMPEQHGWKRVVAVLFVLLDPVLLTHTALVAQDTLLLWAYLFCVNRLLAGRRGMLALGLVVLCFTSMRGMISAAALCLYDVSLMVALTRPRRIIAASLVKTLASYTPAAMLVIIWLAEHYIRTGWIGTSPTGTQYWKPVDAFGVARNTVIVVWRLVDYGRLVLVVLACAGGILLLLKRIPAEYAATMKRLLIFLCISFLVLMPFLLATNNPIGHRYLLPIVLPLNVLAACAVFALSRERLQQFLSGFCLVCLMSGHFWVFLYPNSLAKGWDSTLAHLPYYGLRREMMAFIARKHLPKDHIRTGFPNTGLQRWIDADDAMSSAGWNFAGWDIRDTTRYIFSSTVFNSDRSLTGDKQWRVVQEYASWGIVVRLLAVPQGAQLDSAERQ